MEIHKINAAVRAGLDHCRNADKRVVAIAAFLAGLKASGNWSDSELRAVEIGMLRILRAISDTEAMRRDRTAVVQRGS